MIREVKKRDPSEAPPATDEARLNALLSGEIPPPNSFAKYIIEKMNELLQERTNIERAMREMDQRVKQAQTRYVEVSGQLKSYLDDLKRWDKKSVAEQPEVAEATEQENVDEKVAQ